MHDLPRTLCSDWYDMAAAVKSSRTTQSPRVRARESGRGDDPLPQSRQEGTGGFPHSDDVVSLAHGETLTDTEKQRNG